MKRTFFAVALALLLLSAFGILTNVWSQSSYNITAQITGEIFHLIVDQEAGKEYRIIKDGVEIYKKTASQAGTLAFTSGGPGTFEIRQTTIPPTVTVVKVKEPYNLTGPTGGQRVYDGNQVDLPSNPVEGVADVHVSSRGFARLGQYVPSLCFTDDRVTPDPALVSRIYRVSLNGKWDKVLYVSPDYNGEHDTLHYLAPGESYYIQLNPGKTGEIHWPGNLLLPNTAIDLKQGYNPIVYYGDTKTYYVSGGLPAFLYSPSAPQQQVGGTQVHPQIFANMMGSYSASVYNRGPGDKLRYSWTADGWFKAVEPGQGLIPYITAASGVRFTWSTPPPPAAPPLFVMGDMPAPPRSVPPWDLMYLLGDAYVDGQPVPTGTVVEVRLHGRPISSTIVEKEGKYLSFPVEPDDPTTAEVEGPQGPSDFLEIYVEGKLGRFFDFEDQKWNAKVPWLPGEHLKLDLSATASVPKEARLLQNFPNPFNAETWIPFEVPSGGGSISIEIYNLLGQKVRALELGHMEEGYHVTRESAAYWDGKNSRGERVASGSYFYTLSVNGSKTIVSRKMVVVK